MKKEVFLSRQELIQNKQTKKIKALGKQIQDADTNQKMFFLLGICISLLLFIMGVIMSLLVLGLK